MEVHIQEKKVQVMQEDDYMFFRIFGRPNQLLIPEKQLMLAVLEDAVSEFQGQVSGKKRGSKKGDYLDAEKWICQNNRKWQFSFLNICDTLGLDPGYIRGGIKRWKERHRQCNARKPRVR